MINLKQLKNCVKHGFTQQVSKRTLHVAPISSFLPPFETRDASDISVGVGLSGGVDSATSAYILKYHGFNVIGIFMINWNQYHHNQDDGTVDNNCYESELNDVRDLCSKNKLNIPLKIIEFDDNYYNNVFINYINQLSFGITPNPDIHCAKFITFNKLHEYGLKQLKLDYIATGHYASIEWNNDTKCKPHLRQSKEVRYDQTYFLSQINSDCLYNHLFPIGNYYNDKNLEIRKIARNYINDNEKISNKASSTGLCYIKTGNFQTFINKYIDYNFGEIIDSFGRKLGKHKGLSFYTIGQKIKFDDKYDSFNNLCHYYYIKRNVELYVIDKDIKYNQLILSTYCHPKLWNDYIISYKWNWLIHDTQHKDNIYIGQFRFRDKDELIDGYVQIKGEYGYIYLNDKVRAVTKGQIVVYYNNQYCMASAIVYNVVK